VLPVSGAGTSSWQGGLARSASPRKLRARLGSNVTYLARWRPLLILLFTLILALWWGAASAQSCNGFVAVDGAMLEDDAACYFTAAEGAEHAYIRTDLLTAALGLESDYLPDTGTLRFQKNGLNVDLAATDDVALALSKRPDVLTVAGQTRASRSAVLAGSSYLPLAEVVRAFGGEVAWNGVASLVMVDFSEPLPEAATEPDASEAAVPETDEPTSGEASGTPASATLLDPPRYGVHEGYTRVAVNVPAGVLYELAVDGENFIVLFGSARAEPYTLTPEGAQLSSLGYARVGNGSALALIVGTVYPLSANGKGFEVGTLEAESGEVLYIDFGPTRRGPQIAKLADLAVERLATVKRPASVQKTVVIDPGHGGYDPGTLSDYVVEKDVVLAVGLLLKELLEARGIRVEMTRDDDNFVELEDRAKFAVPSKHNLFISLHANATETAGAEGIETWVFGEPQDGAVIDLAVLENGGGLLGRARTEQAQAAVASIDGDLLREENLSYSTLLAENVQDDLIGLTGSQNRGVKHNYFVVIRDARVPAVLVELGFVNHPVEGPKLAETDYQEMLAEALADGIDAFLARGRTLASSARRTGSE